MTTLKGAPIQFPEGSPQEALALFQQKASENLKDPQALFNLGSVYYLLGEFSSAEKEFAHAVESDPRHFDSHYYLGLIYARRGEWERARKELQVVAEGDPRLMMRSFAQRKIKQLQDQGKG